MNRFIEQFQRLPRSQRWLLAGLSYVVILLAVWFSLISPTLDSIDSAEARNTDLTTKRNAVRARAANRAAFEARLEDLAGKLKQALKELPNGREIPGLLSEIDGLARKSGLDVRKFQPLPEVMHEYYAEVPVQVIMDGGYHEIGIFFDRVSMMSRIVSVSDIDMGTPNLSGEEVSLTVSGKVVTYRFLSDEEMLQNSKRKDKKAPAGGGGE